MTTDATLRWCTHVSYAGRSLRVELYDDGTGLCTCGVGECDHIHHARRLRDQPAVVALEQLRDTYVTTNAVFSDEARMVWAVNAYRLVIEALREQDRVMELATWRQCRADALAEDGVEAVLGEAIRQFNTPGGPGSPIDSEWGTHGHTTPGDIQTAHLGAGSTYDPAIHQEP